MKKFMATSFLILFSAIGLNSVGNADELIDIDTTPLGVEGTLQIDDELIDNGIKYHFDGNVYNVNTDGTLTLEGMDFVPYWTNSSVLLSNGGSYTKSWSVGKVTTSFMVGRNDGKVASRTQYILDNNNGSYVYYNDIVAGRGGVSMQMPRASTYTFGLISRQQARTDYYFTVNF